MLRALYSDLDGTLLGPGGSLFRGGDGGFSLSAARALEACARAGVEVVSVTGRRQQGVDELMRLMGQRSYIFELGCGLVLDGELEWLTGDCVPSPERGTIHAQIVASGGPQRLLEAFKGRLEYHTPWSEGREVSHLFRGEVPLDEANELLGQAGLGWLRLVDNGLIAGHGMADGSRLHAGETGDSGWHAGETAGSGLHAGETGSGLHAGETAGGLHAYHLIPACASKARAVARHMQNRAYGADECIACGDSREDLEVADVVGTFWLTANAAAHDPTIPEAIGGRRNVRVSSDGYGAGVYEAVVTTLAESR